MYLHRRKLSTGGTAENAQKTGKDLTRRLELECPKVGHDSIGASLETTLQEVFRQVGLVGTFPLRRFAMVELLPWQRK